MASEQPSGHASTGGGSTPQINFDATRLSRTDRIVGIASLVLFISLFLPWFSVSAGIYGGSASALSAHGYLYLVLILSILIVAYLVIRALGVWALPDSSPLAVEHLLLIATGINVVLVIVAFLFKPSGFGIVNVGWSYGAFIGLVAAIVAVVPLAGPVIRSRQTK